MKDWVLGKCPKNQEKQIEETIDLAAEAVECFIKQGLAIAMNRYNR